MPTIPVYIRKEDYVKFIEIYSPEWMHEVINRELHPKLKVTSSDPLLVEEIKEDKPRENLSLGERYERGESYESMGYKVDPNTKVIYDANDEPTPGKVDKAGKITELL